MRVPGTDIPLIYDGRKEIPDPKDPTKKIPATMKFAMVGPIPGIRPGARSERERMAQELGSRVTPELWDLIKKLHKKGKRVDGIQEFLGRAGIYLGLETIGSVLAATAIPGLAFPVVAPALAVKRIHDISIHRRTQLSQKANSSEFSEFDRRKAKLALRLYNTAFSPLDIGSVVINKTLELGASIWRGNGRVAKLTHDIAEGDKDLSGLKPIDEGGVVNKTLNFLQSAANSLTFGATAVAQKSAA